MNRRHPGSRFVSPSRCRIASAWARAWPGSRVAARAWGPVHHCGVAFLGQGRQRGEEPAVGPTPPVGDVSERPVSIALGEVGVPVVVVHEQRTDRRNLLGSRSFAGLDQPELLGLPLSGAHLLGSRSFAGCDLFELRGKPVLDDSQVREHVLRRPAVIPGWRDEPIHRCPGHETLELLATCPDGIQHAGPAPAVTGHGRSAFHAKDRAASAATSSIVTIMLANWDGRSASTWLSAVAARAETGQVACLS
jgi:hypothetical protein